MEERTADVVKRYVDQSGLSLRQFVTTMTESLPMTLTHTSVVHWMEGRAEPGTDLLLQMLVAYSDWRRGFALDLLRAKLPEVFTDNVDTLFEALTGMGGAQALGVDVWAELRRIIDERREQ